MIPTRAVLTLSGGGEIELTATTVKCAPDHPMTPDEEASKLATAVGDSLPSEDINGLMAAARGVPERGLVEFLDHVRRPQA